MNVSQLPKERTPRRGVHSLSPRTSQTRADQGNAARDLLRNAADQLRSRGIHDPDTTLRLCAAAVAHRACALFDEGGRTAAWLDVVVRDGGSRLRAQRETASDLLRELAIVEEAELAHDTAEGIFSTTQPRSVGARKATP